MPSVDQSSSYLFDPAFPYDRTLRYQASADAEQIYGLQLAQSGCLVFLVVFQQCYNTAKVGEVFQRNDNMPFFVPLLHLPIPHYPALKRMAIRMAENSEATRDLAALAREVGLSERSLFRNFQKETGLSPGQWRRQMQVLRSLELLAQGRPVTETALEVGYESVGAFIRAFRETVG